MAVKQKKDKAVAAAPEPEDQALVAAAPEAGALVDFWPHPLTSEGRRQSVAAVPEKGASLAEVLRQGGMALGAGPVAARVDGAPVARAEWGRRLVSPGQIVEARAVVQGGGDSEPFEIITAIAVMTLGLRLGPAGLSLGPAAGAAAIGGLVTNALFPVELPDAGEPGRAAFSLHGGANRARPYEPAMMVLGTHRVFPDLAAQECAQFIGDDQYLFQVFDFGVGDLDISEIKIGDALLSSFSDATQETKLPGQAVTLLAGDAQIAAGSDLAPPAENAAAGVWGGWTEFTSGAKAQRLELDFVGVFFGRKKNGEGEHRQVAIQIERREHGTAAWTPATTAMLINSATEAVRKTVAVALPNATKQWDIRARRTAALDSNGSFAKRTTDQGVSWAALRTFQANAADATGRTRLALKIKASGQLQGRIERLSALVKQKVPTWDGSAWSTTNQISSNPADIFRWFVKGVRVGGRLIAGLGLPDSRIDETSIRAWRTWCDTEGLKCDAALTGSQSIADVLNMICRCGRASASWASGKLGVVFDQAGKAPTAMITPGNIIAGTLEVNYADGRLADEVVVRYLDPDFDWQPAELRRLKTGVTAPARTATVTLTGIVSREQAKKETNLIAARQEHHRRRVAWEMGPEGLTIGRGDVVQATSDLLGGGTTGRLQPGGTAASPVLNQAIKIKSGVNYIVLRLLDGTLHTSVVTHPDGPSATDETTRPVLATPLPGLPDNGGLAAAPAEKGATAGDVLWRHYGAADPPRKLKIIEIEPRAMDRYRFTAIDEVPEYYAAAALALTDPLPALRYKEPAVVACKLSEKQIKVADGWANEITAVLTVAGDWRGGVIRARRTPTESGAVAEPWRVVAALDESQTSASWIDQPFGSLEIVVVPGSLVAPTGPALSCGPYTIAGDEDPPDDPEGLAASGIAGGYMALWTLPTDPDYSITEIWDGAQTATVADVERQGVLRGTVKGSVFTRMGVATATPLRVFIRHLDASGNASGWASATVTTLPAADGFTVLWGGGDAKKIFENSNQTHAFRLRSLISQWDFLLIAGKATLDREWNAALIPAKALVTGTSSRSVPGSPSAVRSAIATGGSDNDAFVFDAWQSADHRDLFVRMAGNEPGAIYMIFGLRRSGGGAAGTVPAAPDAPTLLGGAGQISVVITPVSGADGYDLQYKLSSAADAPASWTEKALGNGATTDTITGLADATRYDVQVRARNSAGDSPWSVSASAITDDAASPSVPGAPAAPSVEGGNQQVTVSWSPPSSNGGGAIAHYQLRHRIGSSGVWTTGSDLAASSTSATITGLAASTAYEVQVRAKNSAGYGSWSESGRATTMAATPPEAPAAPSVRGESLQVAVSWLAPSSDGGAAITHYQLRHRIGSGVWTTGSDLAASPTSATIRSLEAGTTYKVQVRAKNSAGYGSWSQSGTGTTRSATPPRETGGTGGTGRTGGSITAPPRPPRPTVTSGNRRLGVTWDAVSRATEYRVQRRTSATSWTISAWGSSRNRTLTGLRDGTIYDVQIQARNSAGPSPWSLSRKGTTLPGTPAAPRVRGGNQKVTVFWSAPSSNGGAAITHYQLRHRIGSSGAWTTGSELVASSTSKVISVLRASTVYEVQVRAKNSAGWGNWSLPGAGPTDRLPAPAVSSGNRQLRVTWPPVSGATQYQVRLRRTGATSWTIASTWGSSRTRRLTNLTNGTRYDVQYQARDTAGPWPLWSYTTTAPPINPVKFRGTLTVGGLSYRRGYTAQMGSLTKTAGTLSITGLIDLRVVKGDRTTLTLGGAPANSDSTFATLTVGSTTFRRTAAATYAGGTWMWSASIGLPAVGSTVTVTLK